MKLDKTTTFDDFIRDSGWDYMGRNPVWVEMAYDFFVRTLGLDYLNLTSQDPALPSDRRDSPTNPAGIPQGERTNLISFMQAINFTRPVNPHRILRKNDLVMQLRFVGDRVWQVGDWFTYATGPVGPLALPDGQHWRRVFRVTRPIICLESIAADNFTDWHGVRRERSHYYDAVGRKLTDYHHGGGTQLFIYQGLYRSALEPVSSRRLV